MNNKYNRTKKPKIFRSIRRSHVVSTYGIGSIYPFKNKYSSTSNSESMMLASINEWFNNDDAIPEEWKVYEPRLQEYLNKDFFILPPEYLKSHENLKIQGKSLPYIRFPQWHRCPRCGLMEKIGKHVSHDNLVCKAKSIVEDLSNQISNDKLKNIQKNFQKCIKSKDQTQLIPVRFLIACEKGHIDDFPFEKWVHKSLKNKNLNSNEHIIKSFGGRGGNSSILGLKFKCLTCNTDQVDISPFFLKNFENESGSNLGPGFKDIEHNCTGFRPWIGDREENCNGAQKVLLRGASNIYYPIIKSSIFIPVVTDQFEPEIMNKINNESFWNSVKDKDEQSLQEILEVVVSDSNLNLEKLKRAIIKKRKGLINQTQLEIEQENQNKIEEEYRYQEYDFIINKKTNDDSELVKHKFEISNYLEIEDFFSNIILIDRLKETRVQTGFSRINPYEEGAGAYKQYLSKEPKKWLPANVVNGEGIFLEFNEKKIEDWANSFDLKKLDRLNKNYNDFRKKRKLNERPINLKFLLIHTFSHLLINKLCFNCGYSSSALRERIYCNLFNKDKNMNGVLIFTSAGDSEGTLGGLVREGEPKYLRKIIYDAISSAANCSYDPICIQTKSQGLGGTNASACHACSFVSETSCEENNQLLNRSIIIGDDNNNVKGYFEDLIN